MDLRDVWVKVTDEDELPVQDVIVRPELLSAEDGEGFVSWPLELLGEAPQAKTNEFGLATLKCPAHLEDSPLETVVLTTEHPRFVNYRGAHFIKGDPAVLKLKNGLRIAATVVRGSTGRKIRDHLVAITSFDANWDLSEKGMLYSNTIDLKEGILRIVHFEAGLPTLFSEEIRIAPGDSRILLKDVELRKGSRVVGRLDEAVTRPIKSGRVFASVCSSLDDAKLRSQDRSWQWRDEAKIEKDGTFVFESVPDDVALQMTAVCDGWISAKPFLDDCVEAFPHIDADRIQSSIEGYDICPQVVRVKGDVDDYVLNMNRSGTLKVDVVDDKGDAIEDAEVEVVPLHGWFDFFGRSPFSKRGTRAIWEATAPNRSLTKSELQTYCTYKAKSDSDGVVMLTNIPQTQAVISVRHSDFELPKDRHLNMRKRVVVLVRRNGQMTLTMNPKRKSPRSKK